MHVNACRIAGLVPESLSLILADRLHWSQVFWITALFMLPGMMMTLATPFYLSMGYTKTEIGLVAKNAGLWMVRLGINRALWLFGAEQLLALRCAACHHQRQRRHAAAPRRRALAPPRRLNRRLCGL